MLPTTVRNYQINLMTGELLVDDVIMSREKAERLFPEDKNYIDWFCKTYA